MTLTVFGSLSVMTLLAACSGPEAQDEPGNGGSGEPAVTSAPPTASADDRSEPTRMPFPSPTSVLILSDRIPEQPTATPEPTPTPEAAAVEPTETPEPTPLAATGGDYDADDDGLIEIYDLAQLDAVRYDLDGDGRADDAAGQAPYLEAYPDPADGMGCGVGGCAGYELVADLDLDTNLSGGPDSGDAYWNSGAGWEPLGRYTGSNERLAFATTFDGGDHTISNLFIARPEQDYVGLFGFSSGGVIRNVTVNEADVTGHDYVGVLVGNNDEGGRVIGCVSHGTVTGNDFVGGLVGDDKDGSRISDSAAAGAVTGLRYVGGLVGRIDGNFGSAARNSSAAGDVTGNAFVGGLVGFNDGGIDGGSATGNVSGNVNVGGLVGRGNGGKVSASLASGDVTGSTNVGGLIGRNDGEISGSSALGSRSAQAGRRARKGNSQR